MDRDSDTSGGASDPGRRRVAILPLGGSVESGTLVVEQLVILDPVVDTGDVIYIIPLPDNIVNLESLVPEYLADTTENSLGLTGGISFLREAYPFSYEFFIFAATANEIIVVEFDSPVSSQVEHLRCEG